MTDQQKQSDDLNFEQALGHLEGIVAELEDGSLSLDDSLAGFERGMKLLRQCHTLLQQAEQKIEVLTSVTRDGQERTRPLSEQPPPATEPCEQAAADEDEDEGTLF